MNNFIPQRSFGDNPEMSRLGKAAGIVAIVAAGSLAAIAAIQGAREEVEIPQDVPVQVVLLQPGESLYSIARDACDQTPAHEVVDFMIKHSGLEDTSLGSLKIGTRLVVPTPENC